MALPSQKLPEVQTRPLGAPQINVDTRGAFGEAVGQGIGQLGQGVEQLGQGIAVAKEKADNAWALDAEAQFHTIATEQETAVLSAKGQNAAAVSADATEKINKAREDLIGAANNPEQARLFHLRTSRAVDGYHQSIERHVSKQVDDAEATAAESTANIVLAKIPSLGTYNDPARVEDLTREAMGPLLLRAQPYGKEAVAAQEQKVRKQVAELVMGAYIGAHDDVGAREAFTLYQKDLGDKTSGFQEHVDALERQNSSLRVTQQITSDPANKIAGTDLLDAKKVGAKFQALGIKDPETYSRTEELLNKAISKAHSANDQANAVDYDNGLAAINQGGYPDAQIMARLNAKNNEGGAKLAASLIEARRARENHERDRDPTAADWALVGDLIQEVRNNPSRYGDPNYTVSTLHASPVDGGATVASLLPPKLLRIVDQTFLEVNGAMNGPDKAYLPTYIDREVKTFLKFPDKGKPSEKLSARYAILGDKLNDAEHAWRKQYSSPMPLEEVRKVLKDEDAKGEVLDSGTLWNKSTTRTGAAIDPDLAGKTFATDADLLKADAQVERLAKAGKPILGPDGKPASKDQARALLLQEVQAAKPKPAAAAARFRLGLPGENAPKIAPRVEPPVAVVPEPPPAPALAVPAAPAPAPAPAPAKPEAPREPQAPTALQSPLGGFFNETFDASKLTVPEELKPFIAKAVARSHPDATGPEMDTFIRTYYANEKKHWDAELARWKGGKK